MKKSNNRKVAKRWFNC